MLYVNSDGCIRLTRGDTARLTVSIVNELTDSDYIIGESDVLVLTVKKSVKDSAPLFQKTEVGSTIFRIDPVDTNSLGFGKYKYDVQLTTANGEVYTIIEPNIFEILPEVTY